MSKDLILELLSQDSYFILNKRIVKILGLDNAFILTFIVDKYRYHRREFYCTIESITEETGLKKFVITSCLKYLKDNELISIVRRECPAKNHFSLNFENLEKLFRNTNNKLSEKQTTSYSNTENKLSENQTDSGLNTEQQEVQKTDIIYNNNRETIIDNNNRDITYCPKSKIQPTAKTKNNEIKNSQKTEVMEQPLLKPYKSKPSDPNQDNFLQIANQIKILVQTQKRISITNSQLNSWATEVKKLYHTLEKARGSEDAIYGMFLIANTLVADVNYEDKYKPVIESGKSFREKFIKLEDYYKRRQIQYEKQQREEEIII